MAYYKFSDNETIIQIGYQDVLPINSEEITEEEYNELLAEFVAKAEAAKPKTDPVIDSIISEVASNGY